MSPYKGEAKCLRLCWGSISKWGVSNISDVGSNLEAGKIRILAVFSDKRLKGKFANLPTAKEQGYDIQWSVIRGFYMGPKVSQAAYDWWKGSFIRMMKNNKFNALREKQGVEAFDLTGDQLSIYVYKQTEQMRQLSQEYQLLH